MSMMARVREWFGASKPRAEGVATSYELLKLLMAGSETWAGIDLNYDEAMQYAPLATAVRVLEEGVSQQPLHVYEYTSPDRRNRDVVRDHNISERLRRPNDFMTGMEWRAWNMRHAATTGDAVSILSRRGPTGDIFELLPVERSKVRIEQLDNWDVVYHVTGRSGGEKTYRSDEVFHFRGPTENGYSGIDIIHQHRQAIGLAIAQDRLASRLFSRGALISGAFSTPGKLTETQRADNQKALIEAYTGENAAAFALLDGGMTFVPTMMDFEKAQLMEARKLQRSVVVAILRVPLHMAGDLDKATFSNIHNLARQAVDYTFMPWMVRFEAAIEQQLMTAEERKRMFVKHNVNSLLRGDPGERAEFYEKMIQNKVMNPNEAREKEEMNPYDGGDEFEGAANLYGDPSAGGEGDSAPAAIQAVKRSPAEVVNG